MVWQGPRAVQIANVHEPVGFIGLGNLGQHLAATREPLVRAVDERVSDEVFSDDERRLLKGTLREHVGCVNSVSRTDPRGVGCENPVLTPRGRIHGSVRRVDLVARCGVIATGSQPGELAALGRAVRG